MKTTSSEGALNRWASCHTITIFAQNGNGIDDTRADAQWLFSMAAFTTREGNYKNFSLTIRAMQAFE